MRQSPSGPQNPTRVLTGITDTAIPANTAQEFQVAVEGILADGTEQLFMNYFTLPAGIILGGCKVSAAGQVTFKLANVTGSPVNTGGATFMLVIFRFPS